MPAPTDAVPISARFADPKLAIDNHDDGHLHYFADVDLEPGDNPTEVIARFQDNSTVRKVFNIHRAQAHR